MPGSEIGAIDPMMARRLGLSSSTRIHAGTTDGVAAFIATRASQPGDAVTSLGTTLNEPSQDLRSLYKLGGFLNLSGAKAESLVGPHFGITRLAATPGDAGPRLAEERVILPLSDRDLRRWRGEGRRSP